MGLSLHAQGDALASAQEQLRVLNTPNGLQSLCENRFCESRIMRPKEAR